MHLRLRVAGHVLAGLCALGKPHIPGLRRCLGLNPPEHFPLARLVARINNIRDRIGPIDALLDNGELCDVLAGYSGALRILCSHIHNLIISDIVGYIAVSAYSSCSTFAFDRRPDPPVGFMALEDGLLLHRRNGGFQSIRIGPVAGSGPFPF